MDKLSQILMRERELLETLLFRLETEQLVLASGRTRWLMSTAREVDSTLTAIRETEILRSVASDQVAASMGLQYNPSLRALAAAVDEPWQTILVDHHEAFAVLTREIAALGDANRDLITAGYRSSRETLMTLGDGVEGYGAGGEAVSVNPRGHVRAQVTAESGVAAAMAGLRTSRRDLTSTNTTDVGTRQVRVEASMQQTAYRASLAATARVMQPSLLDFLK